MALTFDTAGRHGYAGEIVRAGCAVPIGAADAVALDSDYVYNTSGDAYGMLFIPQVTATATKVYARVTSYTGSPTELNVEIRAFDTAGNNKPGALVTNGSASISLSGSPTGWVSATFSTPPTLTRGKHYLVIIGDANGSPSDHVTMRRSLTSGSDSTVVNSLMSQKNTADGWVSPTSLTRPTCIVIVQDGRAWGNPFTNRTTNANESGLYGNRYPAPIAPIEIYGVLGVDETIDNGQFMIYDPTVPPTGSPLHTFDAVDAGYKDSNIVRAYVNPYTVAVGQEFIFALDKTSAGTTPRRHEIGTGADDDLRSCMPNGGYEAKESGGAWVYDTDAAAEIGFNWRYVAPAGGGGGANNIPNLRGNLQ